MSFIKEKNIISFTSNVENYYFQVEVQSVLGAIQEPTIWNWEIKVAVDSNDRCFGMAIERKHDVLIPWQELDFEYTDQMKKLCLETSELRYKSENI
ncbi:TPA: hypothetical protein QCQ87_004819 [Bacillus paranthracis]|nr:hypothetical protein [Bacillus paranthracis]